ncbi:MAG: iron hydrogenase small subunit [Candidatus Diapherotrites archaeon]|nr:iron hydrogenase small subunit [Candidatus Diapherotrites archaeon]
MPLEDLNKLKEVLEKKEFHVVVQVAPALRVSIGEEFNLTPGTIVTKKLVGALKELGFDKVFDTSLSADVVTVEEGTEFLQRIQNCQNLPLFTSCCCGGVFFVERNFPHLLNHFSSLKSPQQSMGALIKTYYAEKENIKPEKIFSVSLMPCVVKKLEANRTEMQFNGVKHVDLVITTKEIAQLMKEKNIDLTKAKETDFDSILGEATGAGELFGQTGGVTESVLRFAASELNEKIHSIEFNEIRGMQGFREGKVSLAGRTINIAIVHGLNNLKDLLSNPERMHNYQVIEIMVCPGGCIGGGGQPKSTPEILEARRNALLKADKENKQRLSSESPALKKLYKEYLGTYGSDKAKKILHTQFKCIECKEK